MAMATYIRIEGDYAEVVQEEVIRRAKVDDLIEVLSMPETDPGRSTGILPMGCRAMVDQNNTKAYFVEHAPTTCRLTFTAPRDADRCYIGPHGTFRVEIPRAVWFLTFDGDLLTDPCMWWIDQWVGDATPLKATVLPNQAEGGQICLGASFRSSLAAPHGQRIDEAISFYWSAAYNMDLTYNYNYAVRDGFRLEEWVAATERGEGAAYVLSFCRMFHPTLDSVLQSRHLRTL